MAISLQDLPSKDQLSIARMARDARADPEAMIVQMVIAYLRLYNDAPAALPQGAINDLGLRAARREGR